MADYEAAARNLRKRTYGSTPMSKTWEQLAPGARQTWIDIVKSVVRDSFGLIKEDRQ